VLLPLLLVVILLVSGASWLVKRSRDARWAREVAVPEISKLADQGKFGDAYALAVKRRNSFPAIPRWQAVA